MTEEHDTDGDVVERLTRIETKLDLFVAEQLRQRTKQEAQGRDIARLQVKAGVWGVLGGLLAGVAAALGLKV